MENINLKNIFKAQLSHCECCPRSCGVDRLNGEQGVCKIKNECYVSHFGLHFGEEPPISGNSGSGAIFFSSCNLKCIYCQNYQISQLFNPRNKSSYSTEELAETMLALQEQGAHNINLVSPTHVIFQAASAIELARRTGLKIPIIYNSNGYDSVNALRMINGLIDIYLPDTKYMNDELAKSLSSAPNYSVNIQKALREMFRQVGHLEFDKDGIARKGLLIRHLVLPGCTENSKRCLDAVYHLSPDVHLSLMSQYSPQFKSRLNSGINKKLSAEEYESVVDYAIELGLSNVFIQELESQSTYLPDFNNAVPFDNQFPL